MSFQAYLVNIQKRTGKTPTDFLALARKQGLVGPDLTAGRLVAWLKDTFGLGHGHAMAIWAVFKSEGWVAPSAQRARATGAAGPARPARAGRRAR